MQLAASTAPSGLKSSADPVVDGSVGTEVESEDPVVVAKHDLGLCSADRMQHDVGELGASEPSSVGAQGEGRGIKPLQE